MRRLSVRVLRLAHGAGLPLPAAQSELAAGCDLAAAIDHPVTIGPGDREVIPTGFALAVPAGFEGQLRPRSGLAAKHGVTVLNSPGTVDADYRGELKVVLVNLGRQSVTITRGMRIAQLVIARVAAVDMVETDGLEPTGRGEAGFGSTGQSS